MIKIFIKDRIEEQITDSEVLHTNHMSGVMRKPSFCICKIKGADQRRRNHESDQGLCFRYIDSTMPILSKSKISSL